MPQSWRWGELPSPPPKPCGNSGVDHTASTSSDDEAIKQQDSGKYRVQVLGVGDAKNIQLEFLVLGLIFVGG